MYSVYLVNEAGTRATKPCGGGEILDSTTLYALEQFERFVVLDAKGVQVFASDDRDSTGAYLPHGVY